MNMITRCPECSTMFKVVQDQLRVSEGWVRCGHCDHVFDARAHFIDANGMSLSMMERAAPPVPPVPQAPTPAPVAPTATQSAPLQTHTAAASASAAAAMVATPPSVDGAAAALLGPAAGSHVAAAFAPLRATPEAPVDVPAPAALAAVPATEPALYTTGLLTSQADTGATAALAAMPRTLPADVALGGTGAPSFLHEGPLLDPGGVSAQEPGAVDAPDPALTTASSAEPSFIQAPAASEPERSGRIVWAIVVAGLLLLLLIVQIVVQERNRIAAASPLTKSAMQWLCARASCSMDAVQKIDALVIESSAFNKVRGDLYKLALSVRNVSDVEVAMPAVELTVTDIQDQAVMRKVLHPLDLGVTQPVLGPGKDWSGSMVVSLSAASLPARVMGYHIEVFYP